jgi:hypothetical protein
MNTFCNLYVSLIHFILAYVLFLTATISNNFKVLLSLLVIISIIKFAFYFFGRCILTLYEYNDHFAPIAKLLSYTLTTNINDKKAEEILINIGILIILNKLLFLIFYKHYIK